MHAEEGVHAIDLTADTFDDFLEENEMAFIDMFAPWYVALYCGCFLRI